MPRPKKTQRQTAKVVVYLTDEQKAGIQAASNDIGKSESEIGAEALQLWLAQRNREAYTESTAPANDTRSVAGASTSRESEREAGLSPAIEQALSMMTFAFSTAAQVHPDEISNIDLAHVHGYMCSNGDLFWVDWGMGSPPKRCPFCSSQTLRKTWYGEVARTQPQ